MAMGQLVAGSPIYLRVAPKPPMRIGLPSVPPKAVSACMGLGVGAAYGLALGHPVLWIAIGVVASLWLAKAGRDARI